MYINNTSTALNLWRNWQTHNNNAAKAMERLSSGLRINSASDDPAGLGISERMKAQLRQLKVQQRNTLDELGSNETADAILGNVQSMLNRMTELSTQAMNGTYDESDLHKLNAEYQQLLQEINRVGVSTYNDKPLFQEKKLFQDSALPDSQEVTGSAKDPNLSQIITLQGDNLNAFLDGVDNFLLQINLAVGNNDKEVALSLGVDLTDNLTDSQRLKNAVKKFTLENGQDLLNTPQSGVSSGVGLFKITVTEDNISVGMTQISDEGLGLKDTNLLTAEGAKKALEAVKNASKSISQHRGDLGAMQNRLQHTLNRLSQMEENMTDSLSHILDADMAKEMMAFTKSQLLSQVCLFLMTQANQEPNQVLALIKSM